MAETDRVNGLIGTLGIKAPVRAATTANIALTGEQTVDGIALVAGDRVLVKNQNTASENGIYYVETGAWTRAPDFDGARDVVTGTRAYVNEGSTNGGFEFGVTTTGPVLPGTSSISWAPRVYATLTQLALAAGASLIGFLQAGVGAVIRTLQDKNRDHISVKDFGAVGNAAADDTAAIQAAVNAAGVLGKAVFFPAGMYKITSSINMPAIYHQYETTRYSTVKIFGEDSQSSIVYNTGFEAAFVYSDVPAGLDAIIVEDIQVYTSTGGGIKLQTGVAELYVNRFFMNGCGAGQWAINHIAGSIITARISGRFWRAFGYEGGVMTLADGINIRVCDSFISQQRKNGPIIALANMHNIEFDNVQIEGANAASTAQTGILLLGYSFNLAVKSLWLEGNINKGIDFGTSALTCGTIDGVTTQFYIGNPSAILVDASGSLNHRAVTIKNIVYNCVDTAIGSGYIINDPNNIVSLDGTKTYNNSGSANQQARLWKQIVDDIDATLDLTLTGCTTAPTLSFRYSKRNKIVTLTPSASSITATSNSVAKTLATLPAELRPANAVYIPYAMVDNGGAVALSLFSLGANGVLTLQRDANNTPWTASGVMYAYLPAFSYRID